MDKFIFRLSAGSRGFTLLEILVALFIFSILSLILASSLHTVINVESSTESKAERLRNVQFGLLILSRDIEQIVNRPVLATNGKEEPAFIGTQRSTSFTHTGFANPTVILAHSSFQRVRYFVEDHALWRETWDALDQAPQSKSHRRSILKNIDAVHFEYLDKNGAFQTHWPLVDGDSRQKQPLPRAVRVQLTISNWGTLSQLYVISAEPSQAAQPPKPGQPNDQAGQPNPTAPTQTPPVLR